MISDKYTFEQISKYQNTRQKKFAILINALPLNQVQLCMKSCMQFICSHINNVHKMFLLFYMLGEYVV